MRYAVSDHVLEVKSHHEDSLLGYPNVRSVGVGYRKADGTLTQEEAVVVGVEKKIPDDQLPSGDAVPKTVDDVPTDVREVGDVTAFPLMDTDREGRHRPVPQGVSCGHPDVTAGSTGWMYETDDGTVYLGSNNHVLAAVNNAEVGDPALQPGTADGGGSDDEVGTLDFYVPVEDGVNVDLAVAEMSVDHENSLVGVDQPVAGVVGELSPNQTLTKSGRTTGVTHAQIMSLDTAVDVNYGDAGTFTITECIMTTNMASGGDSGSSVALEAQDGLLAAGRLFAGSIATSVHHHMHNEIDHLESEYPSIELLTGDDGGGGGEEPEVTVVLELDIPQEGPTTGTITVEVRNVNTGEGVQGATVDIAGESQDSGTTGPNGTVQFTGVPIGSYTVTGTFEEWSDSASISEDDWPSQ